MHVVGVKAPVKTAKKWGTRSQCTQYSVAIVTTSPPHARSSTKISTNTYRMMRHASMNSHHYGIGPPNTKVPAPIRHRYRHRHRYRSGTGRYRSVDQ